MPIIWVKPTLESHREKFLQNVKRNEETGCLEWTAGRMSTGYGQFGWGGVNGGPPNTTAHRAAWWLFKGDVPDGDHLLHKCNNRLCVDVLTPGHVYSGSPKRNMQDRIESGRVPETYRHYDWKNSDGLATAILDELRKDKTIEEVCEALNIGRTTFYRVRNFHKPVADMIAQNKIWHYQRGSRKSKNAKWEDGLKPLVLKEIEVGGNMREIAKRLNITPITLRRWADRFPEIAEKLALRENRGGWK